MPRITYPFEWSQEDRDTLDAMFARAIKDGLWFYHGGLSGPLWFSPKELQDAQNKGRFVWSAENWKLRDPVEQLHEIDAKIAALHSTRIAFQRLINEA